MDKTKQSLLEKVKKHIGYIQEKISLIIPIVRGRTNLTIQEIKRMAPPDQTTYLSLRAHNEKRLEELQELHKTPYFVKCELQYEGTNEKIICHFAKFQFTEESIYSWVAPIASIRFETPGKVSFMLPSGELKHATLFEKEQYMIVDGKIIFFSRETISSPRDLIYQEHFSTRKSGFMLPEIVAQMEKAQDQVIRAHHKGSLVIAGPAGSGKTTLAFHRIAYLVQAPDTSMLYPGKSIIVFVQDNGTKEYFGHLLPELGIKDVKITTFSEWVMNILDLPDYSYVIRYGNNEEEKDDFEYQKLQALRSGIIPAFNARPYVCLTEFYSEYFNEVGTKRFDKQKKEKKLDRFDLTILLQSYIQKIGKLKTRRDKIDISYSMALVDEFQNYLPEQLKLFKQVLNKDTQSIVYVGDMAQQIHVGTIRTWNEVGEHIGKDRNIALKKVYRNTKNILSYIQSLGYLVEIPEGIKKGIDVVETIATEKEEIEYVSALLIKDPKATIGVIARTHKELLHVKDVFAEHNNVHILTMSESQGVEFDSVCLVGIHKDMFTIPINESMTKEHREEKKRIQKDLLYVALTRAISELHVLGTSKLKEVIQSTI